MGMMESTHIAVGFGAGLVVIIFARRSGDVHLGLAARSLMSINTYLT